MQLEFKCSTRLNPATPATMVTPANHENHENQANQANQANPEHLANPANLAHLPNLARSVIPIMQTTTTTTQTRRASFPTISPAVHTIVQTRRVSHRSPNHRETSSSDRSYLIYWNLWDLLVSGCSVCTKHYFGGNISDEH